MKNRELKLTLLIIISIIFSAQAQNDTIDKLNQKGQKDGYWRILLNDKTVRTDSAHASFIAYEVYDNGLLVLSYRKPRLIRISKTEFSGHQPTIGKPELINGTLKYYDSKNILKYEEYFENGFIVYSKFYRKNRRKKAMYIHEFYDFSKRYNNQLGSFYYELAFTPTHFVSYWYRKEGKRWKDFKIRSWYIPE